jgi:acetyltransferase-like isoleucine patch superfamily enzyme
MSVGEPLVPSDRAPGLLVAPGVVVPEDAQIAPYVTIHSGVSLGAAVRIEQGAILGRPQWIDARSRSATREPGDVTVIGAGCQVGSYTVVTAGARIGARTYLGDHVGVREMAETGEDVMVGRHSVISIRTKIGDRTRVHGYVVTAPLTVLEDDVQVGIGVTFVGDPTMGRRAIGTTGSAVVARRASRIGTGAILFPPLEIGEEAVVGAGSLVREDVPPRTVVAGTPARVLRDVRDDELLEEWRPET